MFLEERGFKRTAAKIYVSGLRQTGEENLEDVCCALMPGQEISIWI